MKNKGAGDDEISGSLREQGISPKEINDALGQAKIKNAVSSEVPGAGQEPGRGAQGMQPSILRPERAEPLPTEGSAPSDAELTPPPSYSKIPAAAQSNFGSMTREVSDTETAGTGEYVPQPLPNQQPGAFQPQQPGSLQQEYSPQPDYGGYDSYGQAGAGYAGDYAPGSVGGISDTDTMIEIAEQVFSEKIKTLHKQIEDFGEFKALAETRIQNLSERMNRSETTIDRLQAAILEKVGSYGRGLDSVKKEMSMMQDSFSKMVGKMPAKEHHKHTQHATHTSPAHHTTSAHSSHTSQKTHAAKKTTKRKTASKKK